MTMIERVARAIYASEGNRIACHGDGSFRDKTLEDENMDSQMLYLDYARAAIEAMHDPTKEMLFAGEIGLSNAGVDDANTQDAKACFRAMIDKAQEEGEER